MLKKVLLRAPVLSMSGYGVHSRQIARWLLSRSDIDLTIHPVQWGNTPWYINPDMLDGLIGQIMSRAKDDKGPFDISFQVQLPDEWSKLAEKDIGVTACVETDFCNPSWVKAAMKMHRVIVPSTFCRDVFELTCVKHNDLPKFSDIKDKFVVIPESYIDSCDKKELLQPFNFETSFNFLMVGQLTGAQNENDRKNVHNTLNWFCEEFADDSDVGLVIKTNSGRETKIDRMVTKNLFMQAFKSFQKKVNPRVYLIHGSLSDDEMASLYRHPTIKAFVTMTRGEGYGLPALESAVSGVPVIATNWSGHLDFLKLGKFIKLDFNLQEIHSSRVDNRIFMSGAKWAEVNKNEFKHKLRKFKERSAIPLMWAKELVPKLQENFSWSAVKAKYEKFFEENL